MDALFFHPKLVHVPIALGVLMPLIAGALLVAWRQAWLPPRAWLLAVALQALLVGSGALAMRSGEAEEERVERFVAERYIEAHEEAAEAFVWGGGLVLAGMILASALARGRAGVPVATLATAGTVLVLWLGVRAGEAGGALVYEHGAAAAYTGGAAGGGPPPGQGEGDDGDD